MKMIMMLTRQLWMISQVENFLLSLREQGEDDEANLTAVRVQHHLFSESELFALGGNPPV